MRNPFLYASVLLLAGQQIAAAQVPGDFRRLLDGAIHSNNRKMVEAEWQTVTRSDKECVDKALREHGSNLKAAQKSGLRPSDRRLSEIWASCQSAVVGDQKAPTYYVANTQPPDAYLSLRTHPTAAQGQRIATMPNGTPLEVLSRRADGWWRVRVVPSGLEGWAMSRGDGRDFIECCQDGREPQRTMQAQSGPSAIPTRREPSLSTNKSGSDVELDECDRLAESKIDPNRRGTGLWPHEIDTSKAIPACEKAASREPHNPRFFFQLGRAHYTAKAFTLAAENFRKAAELGYSTAHVALGQAYLAGEGVAKDYDAAAEHIKRAADAGHATGQAMLGTLYQLGMGVIKDPDGALKLYKEAAEKGDPYGQLFLGLNLQGKNDSQAIRLLTLAADQGEPRSLVALGNAFQFGQGVPKNEKTAALYFEKAANTGNSSGQTGLGVLYRDGQGVGRSDSKAADLFRKAAEQNNPYAQANLGFMYENGRGVTKDLEAAVSWYQKAADQNNAVGQYYLANMYAGGRGVPRDREMAVRWYEKAAAQGNQAAETKLAALKSTVEALKLRNPKDVVAQVLNYSRYGRDEGIGESFWYKSSDGACIYKNYNDLDGIEMTLDLNEIDPRALSFGYDRLNLQGNRDLITVIRHDGHPIMQVSGDRDLDRLARGWGLIFQKYCRGKERPF